MLLLLLLLVLLLLLLLLVLTMVESRLDRSIFRRLRSPVVGLRRLNPHLLVTWLGLRQFAERAGGLLERQWPLISLIYWHDAESPFLGLNAGTGLKASGLGACGSEPL